ncbi:MAG TPA: class I SAM-dependent methyltransferase [Candidatus Scatomorpha merdigallinarum]|nr:class I SAM-dependent methyltransferase [Candidatus Scatomorpha merdigallinarum]
MSEIPAVPELGAASRTMLLTLAARARESRLDAPLFHDPEAEAICDRLEISSLGEDDWMTANTVTVRTVVIDGLVRDFCASHENAVCVNLGCGLDTRASRLGGSAQWYELDLPEVISLRRKYIPESSGEHCIASDVRDMSWANSIPDAGANTLIIAEGLLMYFDRAEACNILSALSKRFPGSTMIIELLSTAAASHTELVESISASGAGFRWGVDDAVELCASCPELTLEYESVLADLMHLRGEKFAKMYAQPEVRRYSNRVAVYSART